RTPEAGAAAVGPTPRAPHPAPPPLTPHDTLPRYARDAVTQGQLVGLSVTSFNAVRSKEERVAQDEAGARRWGRRGGRTRWG
ncbi:hypothetical protein R0J90_11585, partial [Micrococcus sp. SIMBA_144]